MGIFNEFHRKEKPVFTGIARGVGGFAFGAAIGGAGGGGVANIEASGGIIHEWTEPGPGVKYRAHIFINPGNFDVSSIPGSHPGTMEYLVVGGGGGGAGDNGGGGGGSFTGTGTVLSGAGGSGIVLIAYDTV